MYVYLEMLRIDTSGERWNRVAHFNMGEYGRVALKKNGIYLIAIDRQLLTLSIDIIVDDIGRVVAVKSRPEVFRIYF